MLDVDFVCGHEQNVLDVASGEVCLLIEGISDDKDTTSGGNSSNSSYEGLCFAISDCEALKSLDRTSANIITEHAAQGQPIPLAWFTGSVLPVIRAEEALAAGRGGGGAVAALEARAEAARAAGALTLAMVSVPEASTSTARSDGASG